MFDQVYQNLRAATEASIRMQQDLFKKWLGLWTPGTAPNGAGESAPKIQERWAKFLTEQAEAQRETLEAQFRAGLKHIEEAFRLAEAKSPEELRGKTLELWQKSFDCLKQLYDAQARGFQTALARWTELMSNKAEV
jgi:hypothetical protein